MTIEQDLRELISDISNTDQFSLAMYLQNYIERYNEILNIVQQKFSGDIEICNKIPMQFDMFGLSNQGSILIKNCKNLLNYLTNKNNNQNTNHQSIVFNIGSLHGNLSFDNIITTIQNSNIGNREVIIKNIKEFREELKKSNPSKNKLNSILDSLKGVGEGVIAGLLVEVGKRFLGL